MGYLKYSKLNALARSAAEHLWLGSRTLYHLSVLRLRMFSDRKLTGYGIAQIFAMASVTKGWISNIRTRQLHDTIGRIGNKPRTDKKHMSNNHCKTTSLSPILPYAICSRQRRSVPYSGIRSPQRSCFNEWILQQESCRIAKTFSVREKLRQYVLIGEWAKYG